MVPLKQAIFFTVYYLQHFASIHLCAETKLRTVERGGKKRHYSAGIKTKQQVSERGKARPGCGGRKAATFPPVENNITYSVKNIYNLSSLHFHP